MKEPKLRIRKVFKRVVENHGTGIGKAMIEEGYSKNSAVNPKNVTESKSWEMLLEEYLPDDLLTKTAQEGLKATQVKTSFTEPDKVIPDYSVRQRYLETTLKMKKKIGEGDKDKKVVIEISFVDEKSGNKED